MARIVLGIGTSHSPLLVLGGAQWEFRAQDDRRNKGLNTLDGRFVSYDSDESGRAEVYVRAASAAGGKWRVSSAGGDSAVWSRDGRELFYLSPDADLMSVSVAPGAEFKGSAPVRLFKIPGEILHLEVVTQYDVGPDGRFLMNLNKSTPGQKLITLVSNWTSLLPSR